MVSVWPFSYQCWQSMELFVIYFGIESRVTFEFINPVVNSMSVLTS